MEDVVIVGGGLTGLAAAYELQQLRIPYTLIEVKPRLGGSILTESRGGFLVDSATMGVSPNQDWAFLEALGLPDALVPAADDLAVFRGGAQSLVDSLAKPLTGTIIRRMAVSSVGYANGRCGVCLENGLVREARALIITAPARYAAHMLYSLEPEAGRRLGGYRYDSVVRLSLGYPRHALPAELPPLPPDMAFVYVHRTETPHRCPPGTVLAQLGLRFKPEHLAAPGWITTLLQELDWPSDPLVAAPYAWSEADPLTCHEPGYQATLAEIHALLPENVLLAGSDYGSLGMAARVQDGRAAARRIASLLS